MLLETERLQIRSFTIEDAPFVLEILNEKGFIQFIGNRNVVSLSDARNYIRDRFHSPQKINGFSMYLVENKEGSIPIGMCGLVKRNELDCPDLGFAFLEKYTGYGFAFEASSAMVKHAKNMLKLDKLAAITQEDNTRSIQLLKKLGFDPRGEKTLQNDDKTLMLFEKQLY